MNTGIDPCEPRDGYVFQHCMYKHLMEKIGCQPFWLDFLLTEHPNCTEASQISRFLEAFLNLTSISSENELMEEYSCLRPCSYMEYKV